MPLRQLLLSIALTALLALPQNSIAAQSADSTASPSDSVRSSSPADSAQAPSTDSKVAKPEEKAKAKEAVSPKKAKKSKTKAKAASSGKGTEKTMEAGAKTGTMPVKPEVLPTHVQVQHILIGFSGSVTGKNISRTKDEAKTLAYQILDRARKGENFDELVRQYTDDSPPGIYGMSGIGVAPQAGEFPRDRMVPAFGNVGFSISPGNIGIADFDPQASPFGWHIIKRLK
ncbi:MAG TPA: peptidylprolyl isomerase [Candidatus Eisenbacteria bacterium]